MGTSHSTTNPRNKTGKNVVRQKLESATKTGILSLQEHKLEQIPDGVFTLTNLRTLDISKNLIQTLPNKLETLVNLKSLNCDDNKLTNESLSPIRKLDKLQNLQIGGNKLGKTPTTPKTEKQNKLLNPHLPTQTFPELTIELKQLKLDRNYFETIPPQVYSPKLVKLEKLNLSNNLLAAIPAEISNLSSLMELNLDDNSLVSLPVSIGKLRKLKSLSLRNNHISVTSTSFSEKNPQPIPAELFTDTVLIDLNLAGNKMTNTQLNTFEGFNSFLKRREDLKTKNIYGGALTDLNVCGLE